MMGIFRTHLLFPRTHTVRYKDYEIKYESHLNYKSLSGSAQRFFEGWMALRAVGIEVEPELGCTVLDMITVDGEWKPESPMNPYIIAQRKRQEEDRKRREERYQKAMEEWRAGGCEGEPPNEYEYMFW